MNEQRLQKDSEISKTFNNYFVNITDELEIFNRLIDSPKNATLAYKVSLLTTTEVSMSLKTNIEIRLDFSLNLYPNPF